MFHSNSQYSKSYSKDELFKNQKMLNPKSDVKSKFNNAIKRPNYPHEIIEFPAVLVDLTTGERVATFHSFVRPRINPILSDFCKKLTGISQELGVENFVILILLLYK